MLKQVFMPALLTLFVTGHVAFSATGFLPVNTDDVPAKVREAAKSVFRVGFAQGPATIEKLNEIQIPKIDDSNYWRVIQLRLCEHQGLANCPVLLNEFSGTAFLIRDKYTVATNLHNIQDWIHHAIVNNEGKKPEEVIPPLFLLNEEGDFVYNPFQDGRVSLTFYNRAADIFATPMWESLDNMQMRISDYVELTFEKEFAQNPIQEAATPSPADEMFMVGFPNRTTYYTQLGLGDSDGLQIYLSRGHLLPGKSLLVMPWMYGMAAGPGSSGSPLLNRDGEASAVLFLGNNIVTEGGIEERAGFIPLDRDLLMNVWGRAAVDLKSVKVD